MCLASFCDFVSLVYFLLLSCCASKYLRLFVLLPNHKLVSCLTNHPKRMPLSAEHPRIQTRSLNIRERKPEVLQRLSRPEALLHVNPVVLTHSPHICKLCISKRGFTVLFHSSESFPRPVAVALLARNAPCVEERLDILGSPFVFRLDAPEAAFFPLLLLALRFGSEEGLVVAEFGCP
jgi:hypothetical protein